MLTVFVKMAPHSIETILRPPHWPSSLTHFVTWCLMWDPKSRPTSTRALQHEYFADAVDPLRPKPISRSSSRKPADIRVSKESSELSPPLLQTRPSWFRRSFVGKESSIPVAIVSQPEAAPTKAPTLHLLTSYQPPNPVKARPSIEKRLTWAGTQGSAPIPILPSIRPLSPLPNTVNAHVSPALKPEGPLSETSGNRIRLDLGIEGISTINRQPSVNRGNGIAHERSTRSTGHSPRLLSPPSSHKENSFLSSLSHLRKRARRISGRNQLSPESAFDDDIEAAVGCGPWNGIKPSSGVYSDAQHSPRDTESAMSSMKSSLDPSMTSPTHSGRFIQPQQPQMPTHKALKRQHSMPQAYSGPAPIPSRTRRPMHSSKHPTRRYEAPNEEEELQNEMAAAARNRPIMQRGYGASVSTTNVGLTSLDSDLPLLRTHYSASDARSRNPYPTPSPPQKNFLSDVHKPLTGGHRWPTPPEEQQSDWAIAALQSVYSVGGNSYL